jgi:hypothetical protein
LSGANGWAAEVFFRGVLSRKLLHLLNREFFSVFVI